MASTRGSDCRCRRGGLSFAPMTGPVCAIIVTYNRAALLAECVKAVLGQTEPVANILVIDNASTDSTAELLAREAASVSGRLRHLRLETNLGGAGGFRYGLKRALETEAEWFWLMDDDTIPAPTALAELLAARDSFPEATRPCLLASKVNWIDGQIHPMNLPTAKQPQLEIERALVAAERGTLSVRWASFVSVLLERSAVVEHGLPYGDYFIWNDDTEYTARMLREGFGVLAPRSIVTHKTGAKHSPMNAAPARAYYQVRNVLWMILRSPAWRPDEKIKIALVHLQWISRYLSLNRFSAAGWSAVGRGLRDGFFRQPRQ